MLNPFSYVTMRPINLDMITLEGSIVVQQYSAALVEVACSDDSVNSPKHPMIQKACTIYFPLIYHNQFSRVDNNFTGSNPTIAKVGA